MNTKLSVLRKASGMSQSQLAEKVKISVRTLQHYEQGQKPLDKAAAITVYKLAVTLGCTVADLIIDNITEGE